MLVVDGGRVRPETDAEYRARMDAKAARERHFREQDARAASSQDYALRHPRKTPPAPPQAPKTPPAPAPRTAPAPKRGRRRHTHCIDCGRRFRRPGDPITPDTVRYGVAGRCWKCDTLSHGGQTRERHPERCSSCGWKVRSSNHTAAQYPDTRIYAGHGLCATCTRREGRRNGTRSPR